MITMTIDELFSTFNIDTVTRIPGFQIFKPTKQGFRQIARRLGPPKPDNRQEIIYHIKCLNCHEYFLPRLRSQVYCRKECKAIKQTIGFYPHTCKACQTEYHSPKRISVYCSFACRRKYANRVCVHCGTIFQGKKEQSKCCSMKCYKDYRTISVKTILVCCLCCGLIFSCPTRNPRKFCDRACGLLQWKKLTEKFLEKNSAAS